MAGERISTDSLRELIADKPDKLFVAHMDEAESGQQAPDSVVGCICAEWAMHKPDLSLPEDHAMLGLFAVDPQFQSKGVGSALLSHATEFVQQEWQCKRIVLWVIEQRSDIIEWYTRCGFQVTEERLPFVLPDLAKMDNMQFAVLVKEL